MIYLYIPNMLDDKDFSRQYKYYDDNNSEVSRWIKIFFYQSIGINEESIKKIIEIVWNDYQLSDIRSLLDFLEKNMGEDISLYQE